AADIARARGRDEIPLAVDQLIASLLSKDPEGRPASAAVLIEMVRGLGDAARATEPDVRAPELTPIGSRIVAMPPGSSPLSARQVSAPTRTAPTAAAVAVPATLPATRQPARAWMMALRVVLLALLIVGAGEAYRRYSWWSADRLSLVPMARADLERAVDDYWELDLDKLDDDTNAAIALDPSAPMAFVLRQSAGILVRGPLVRRDAELMHAREAAKRRTNMMVNRTRSESMIDVLSSYSSKDVTAAFTAHCDFFHGCTDLEKALIAVRLPASDVPPSVEQALLDTIGTDRPLIDLMRGRVLRWEGKLDESKALLRAAIDKAPGRPALVEGLVDTELERGDTGDAIALLDNLAQKDPTAAIRAAFWRVRTGDKDALAPLVQRFESLPAHSKDRIDGLSSIGYHYAALGRFHDADVVWLKAIADREMDTLGDARALETAAIAVLYALVLGDNALAQSYGKVVNDIGIESGPGVERIAVFQRASRALMASYDDSAPLATAQAELKKLSETPNDTPLIEATVRWHVAMKAGDVDGANKLAEKFDPCFRDVHLAIGAQRQHDHKAAVRFMDQALDPKLERHCTTGDDLIPDVLNIFWGNLIRDRAVAAMQDGDRNKALEMLDRYDHFWPSADPRPDVETVRAWTQQP
ncbi:MAG TPA: tetratricopeptide repeat protein, partial [Myxococcota bacterium]